MNKQDKARWLADMIPAIGDYAKEASIVLIRQADEIDRLRAENERLRKIEMAARNLVDNSYAPSCDGDRQRWVMLQAALQGEGEE